MLRAADERSTHVAGFIPVALAGSVVTNRHDDSIYLALSGRRSRRSRPPLARNPCYLRRRLRGIVGRETTLGDWHLGIQPRGLGRLRWAEPTLRGRMRSFLAGASECVIYRRARLALAQGAGLCHDPTVRDDTASTTQGFGDRKACASQMSDSGGRIMAQKASKKLPLCATFLPFPRQFRWLANDVFYGHGLEAPIGGRLEMTTRLSCPGLRR